MAEHSAITTWRSLHGAAALAWPACAADLSVKVVGISDGDTVRVIDDKKKEFKVRLSGIDAPEFGQVFGTESNEALSEKLLGKKVTLKSHGEDDYGRTLGTLMLDKRNISQEMVAEGWAWP
jgi:micrococcal nuclease